MLLCLLCTSITMRPYLFVLTVATGLPSCSPQVFWDPSEGFRGHFSESLRAAEGVGSVLLFCLAAARKEAGASPLRHTPQRGHQQWTRIQRADWQGFKFHIDRRGCKYFMVNISKWVNNLSTKKKNTTGRAYVFLCIGRKHLFSNRRAISVLRQR